MSHAKYSDDPVAAYDRLAPQYSALSSRREAYLRSIENLVASRIPAGSRSILDVGAGNGARAFRIAEAGGIGRVVLLEPSLRMAAAARGRAEIWSIRAEELSSRTAERGRFEVVTCLWNVLGHIHTAAERVRALRGMAECLSADGFCFLDVNHRYNARAYGVMPTLARALRDAVSFSETSGDVSTAWDVNGTMVSTRGHFFTHGEIRELTEKAGLRINERIVVDYESGALRKFGFEGNLLYILRRTSRTESSNAQHTS